MTNLNAIVARLIKRPHFYAFLALLATTVSVWRICASYHELSQTMDEADHLSTGMQLVQYGSYTLEPIHPPLARACIAALPYLDGSRLNADTAMLNQRPVSSDETNYIYSGLGNDILYGQGNYWRTLTLARLGVLPFYLLSVFILWVWTKKLFGEQTAFFAVLFYTLIPPILAHAGLATTNIPATATFLSACYTLWWWMQEPNFKRSLALGIVVGFSLAIKFSFILFFGLCGPALIVYEVLMNRRAVFGKSYLILAGELTAIILLTSLVVLWACYGFSIGSLRSSPAGANLPAPAFFDGISDLLLRNSEGRATFFLGHHMSNHGAIWYFPLALAVKTPITILILMFLPIAVQIVLIIKKQGLSRLWKAQLVPLLIATVLLLAVLPSNIQVGIRHLLPIYPFLAMLGALGAYWLWLNHRGYIRIALLAFIIWAIGSSVSYDPDRLAYFNEFTSASSNSPVLVESDLDWGQDANKLSDTLRARGINWATIGYFGRADLKQLGITNFELSRWYVRPNSEWVAISKFYLYACNGFAWLQSAAPVARIGNSMLLYHQTLAEYASLLSPGLKGAETLASNSPSPETFLKLSLEYYRSNRFEDCVAAARKAIMLKPDFAVAYNNVCAANNHLGNFEDARKAGEEAVRLDPTNQMFRNNLNISLDGLNKK